MKKNGNNRTAKYRKSLPQLSGELFLTDGGVETTLIFHEGFDLPEFAAFDILKHKKGRQALRKYYHAYANIAQKHDTGFILESVTWRASQDWGKKIGYSLQALRKINRQAIELLSEIREEYENEHTRIVISGCVGPRGDGYSTEASMTADEAEQYHRTQIETLAGTEADMITALTMTYTAEATGVVRAAQSAGIPVVISFTVETDGRLPSGQTLKDAIEAVDEATNCGPIYYMINCAHPTHFEDVLNADEPWAKRIRGLRANASHLSHAELDEAEELDDGNPVELGGQYQALKTKLQNLNILGGCCGTDHRHIEAVCQAYIPPLAV